jgi:general secretion pathway protein G
MVRETREAVAPAGSQAAGSRHQPPARPPREASGFTLIELVTVIALLAILAAVALPGFRSTILGAREAVLKEDLFQFRDLIDQYHADKGHYPETLEALVEEGYLRKIPKDPITEGVDWEVIYEEIDPDNPTDVVGIYDVRSSAPGVGLDGTPYNEW